jgi:hypothetical protein
MGDLLARFWTDLIGRTDGPMTFRLILQPTMSIMLAIRDGVKDAREGRPAYFWTIFNEPEQRRALLREGWRVVVRVVAFSTITDAVCQIWLFRTIRPLELVVVALLLALVPYLLWRGPVNRLAKHWIHPKRATVR